MRHREELPQPAGLREVEGAGGKGPWGTRVAAVFQDLGAKGKSVCVGQHQWSPNPRLRVCLGVGEGGGSLALGGGWRLTLWYGGGAGPKGHELVPGHGQPCEPGHVGYRHVLPTVSPGWGSEGFSSRFPSL